MSGVVLFCEDLELVDLVCRSGHNKEIVLRYEFLCCAMGIKYDHSPVRVSVTPVINMDME